MIGVFDSGVGGLAVLKEIRLRLPDNDLMYVADRTRAPFGVRSLEEVADIAAEVGQWLVDRGATTLVVACNTASAAGLKRLRATFADLPVVGMEPAVKPAVSSSKTKTVGVFATAATFQGELFASLVERFASETKVVTRACPEWVELVEAGITDGPEVERSVTGVVQPVVELGADVLVLGCTHFSFIKQTIAAVSGLEVIDPAPAVATQTARVATTRGGSGMMTLAGSGDLEELALLASRLAGIAAPVIRFDP